MKNIFDFVEKYYPNYSSSDEIARWLDLQSLIDEDYTPGSSAEKLLDEEFGGDYDKAYPMIIRNHIEVQERVLARAIEGYVERGGD